MSDFCIKKIIYYMYIVIVSVGLGAYIVLTSFRLTVCEWMELYALKRWSTPSGWGPCSGACARWGPSAWKLPLAGSICATRFCRTGPLGFFH